MAIHDFLEWLRTGSNLAFMNRIRSHTGKMLHYRSKKQKKDKNVHLYIFFPLRP